MKSIGTTHVSGWRGFNYGRNSVGIPDILDGDFDDIAPSRIADAQSFCNGRAPGYQRRRPELAEEVAA